MPLSSRVIKRVAVDPGRFREICFVQRIQVETQKPEMGPNQATISPQAAQAEAEAIIGEAKAQAEALVAKARREAEGVRIEAQRQGYEAGYQEGLCQGLEGARQARLQAVKVLKEARKQKKQVVMESEQEIIHLALHMAEKIIRKSVELDPGVVVSISAEALRRLCENQEYIIFAHPEDVALIREKKEELMTNLDHKATLRILPDEGIERGGCRVVTEDGELVATVSSQLQELEHVLAGGKG